MKLLTIILSVFVYTNIIAQTIDDNPIVAGFSLNQPFNERDMPNLLKDKQFLTDNAKKYYEACEKLGKPKAVLADQKSLKEYYKYETYFAWEMLNDGNVDNSRFTRYFDNILDVSLRYTSPYAYKVDSSFPKMQRQLAEVMITLNTNSSGWNSNHFENILNDFKIKFGEPTLINKSESGAIDWIWSGKKNILIFRYLFTNSLDKPTMRIEFMTKKFYNQFY